MAYEGIHIAREPPDHIFPSACACAFAAGCGRAFCLACRCDVMNYDAWRNYSDDDEALLLHGTAVSVDGCGLLVLGPSGAGKSLLAIEMLALGAQLVSDDRVWLRASQKGLLLQAPDAVAGRIEARGIGLLSCAHTPEASLKFCIDLSQNSDRRLPFVVEVTKLRNIVSVIPGRPEVPRAAALLLLLQNGFAAYD